MLRLHTGVPGTGKSLQIIDDIEHQTEYAGRTVYAHAIEGWIRAVNIRCLHDGCRTCRHLTDLEKVSMRVVEHWFEWAQPGDLFVIDEAHYPFPSRREKEQPMHVQRLTESRHDGVDFWFATPNANFLDINVRRLIQQHVHFTIGITGRWRYTHTGCMDGDDKLALGNKEPHFLQKRSYKFYKSADAHVKLKSKIPLKMYYVAALPIVGVLAVWWAVSSAMSLKSGGNSSDPVVPVVESAEPVSELRNVVSTFRSNNQSFVNPPTDRELLPVVGCLLKHDDCVCYDSESEHVAVSLVQCKANAEGDLSHRDLVRF